MLAELPDSQVDNLCSILHKEWPKSIHAINYLKTCAEWKTKNPNLDTSIFYNPELVHSGVFILIQKSGCMIPIVTAYALDSYEKLLEECLLSAPIDWNKIFIFSLVSKKYMPMVENILRIKDCKILHSVKLLLYSMEMNEAKNLEIHYPNDVEIRTLSKSDLQDIYDVWVMNDFHTIEELENCLEYNTELALGVFDKNGRSLSRCMRSHNGSISALQTVEEARGKGYATLLMKHASKTLASLSIVPYTYTIGSNKTAQRVFQTAGFKAIDEVISFDIGRKDV